MVIKNRAVVLWLPLALAPATAWGGYGAYTHGYGIKSLGMAGIGAVLAEDTFTLSINPANAVALGTRVDVGLDLEMPDAEASIRGNLIGPDETSESRARLFPVPQAGAAFPLGETLAMGFTGFFAGLGSDYTESPFTRFGGPERTTLALAQAGLSSAIAWSPRPDQALGVSLNLSYQAIEVKGVDAFEAYSSDPEHFTDQGLDPCLGFGFTLGWRGRLTERLAGAVSFRSKSWTQRSSEYAGLLPDRGTLDLPAMMQGGLSWMPHPRLTIAAEYQRVLYAEQRATGNPGIDAIREGRRLGEKDGPGFGWHNQDIGKIGFAWKATPVLHLRGGYSHGSQQMPREETLLGTLAPTFARDHFTVGATIAVSGGWEASGYVGYSPKRTIRGENSIPLIAGGGEADMTNEQMFAGFSFGRKFD
ncbi:MAG TPA: outer membrane protein transport protein [Nevskiaceae bacterium]|nr:outer membrane protein transport protein [Nevskiaceae bacterium]